MTKNHRMFLLVSLYNWNNLSICENILEIFESMNKMNVQKSNEFHVLAYTVRKCKGKGKEGLASKKQNNQ